MVKKLIRDSESWCTGLDKPEKMLMAKRHSQRLFEAQVPELPWLISSVAENEDTGAITDPVGLPKFVAFCGSEQVTETPMPICPIEGLS